MRKIVGIDLGTTNSVCAIADGADVTFIENSDDRTLTPSCVALRGDGELALGWPAVAVRSIAPTRSVSEWKRNMGAAASVRLGRHDLDPVTLSAMVLASLRADAERLLGETVGAAVVTVPAYFNDNQRYATKRAAEAAGLAIERVLNEPTAAAIAYGLDRGAASAQFLVFDLGGGTFDVCVMELFEGMLAVKSVAGESRLGGEDFTEALYAHIASRLGIAGPELERIDAEWRGKLRLLCEAAKLELTSAPFAVLEVPARQGAAAASLTVTALEANAIYRPLVDHLLGPCRSALRGANTKPTELDEIVLVGGATRMPIVREFVADMFGRKPMTDVDPDLVVAKGAAIQASLCLGDSAVGDIIVTDVASHSVGVDRPRRRGATWVKGTFVPIIHRNTVIPASCTEEFDLRPNEREIHVYEGEAERVRANAYIGSIPIPRTLASNERVALTFTYDLNGILEVEAQMVGSAKKVVKVLKRR